MVIWRPTRHSRTNTPKWCPFHYRGLECKNRKSRNTWSNRQIWPWSTEWSRAKTNRILPRERTGHSKHPLPTTQEKTLHMDITRWSTTNSHWLLSRWCHPTISSSVIPFSSRLQSFPVSGSFQMSQLFVSGGQSTEVSASEFVLPMSIQDWFPLGWTGWISLQSKRFSRVFSNTTVQKHQFFGSQPSLWSSSHIHTWLLEKP